MKTITGLVIAAALATSGCAITSASYINPETNEISTTRSASFLNFTETRNAIEHGTTKLKSSLASEGSDQTAQSLGQALIGIGETLVEQGSGVPGL